MAVTLDTTTGPIIVSGGTSMSWSHTVGAGASRYLFVGLSIFVGASEVTPTTRTYAGQNLTIVRALNVDGSGTASWMGLVNPTSGAGSVSLVWSGTGYGIGGAASYTDVDQSTPLGASVVASDASGFPLTATITVPGSGLTANDLVVAVLKTWGGATSAGGQTQYWNADNGEIGAAAAKAGNAAGVTISWTGAGYYALVAVPIKAAAASGPQTVSPQGIASAEVHGSPTVTRGAVTVAPGSIASAQALGSPTVTLGPTTVAPTGIASAETHGSPTVTRGAVTVSPSAIGSAEAHGSPTVTVGTRTVAPTGIPSAEAVGSPTLTTGAVTVAPTAIPSAEAFGVPAVVTSGIVAPVGIPSAEAHGSPTLTTGPVTVSPTGIASAEAFGSPSVFFPSTEIAEARNAYTVRFGRSVAVVIS